MEERFSLKDHLFNEAKVRYLAKRIQDAYTQFNADGFVAAVMKELPMLALKDRIRHIATTLHTYLPTDYEVAAGVIVRSLPPPLDLEKTDDDFGDFIFAPFGEYVARYGLDIQHLVLSLATLRELTMRFSMEDAIRYFLRVHQKETVAVLHTWARDENYHVRRLVSEGARPLLPWSGRIPLTTTDTLPLLTILHADRTRYVTRSVANHLNDLTKSEPDVVIAVLKEWQSLGLQSSKELTWMTKHALRTLIKRGCPEALALLGYTPLSLDKISFTLTPAKVSVGDIVTLTLTLNAPSTTNVLIDYRIHFVKKNGTRVPKVFKWKTATLKSGEILTLTKKHHLKADASTFTRYPGEHVVDVQINGVIVCKGSFMLTA